MTEPIVFSLQIWDWEQWNIAAHESKPTIDQGPSIKSVVGQNEYSQMKPQRSHLQVVRFLPRGVLVCKIARIRLPLDRCILKRSAALHTKSDSVCILYLIFTGLSLTALVTQFSNAWVVASPDWFFEKFKYTRILRTWQNGSTLKAR